MFQNRRLTVDSAHLLSEHDGASGQSSSSDPRNDEAVSETAGVRGALGHCDLLGVQHMRVVEISGGDDGMFPDFEV